MREAAAEGVTVQAHCENGYLVDAIRDEFVAGGRTALRHHAAARPVELEEEAVHRFLAVARLAGADAYVVHVSSAAAVDQIERARGSGQTVFAEACSHHLAFDESAYEHPDASRYVMTPPLRSEGDRRAIWNALARGRINVYASDHGHLTLAEKLAGGEDFTGVEPGVPGVEARLAVGFTFGVDAGLISKERLIAAACTEPARIFGLYPRKGAVVPGADGDLVVWDTRVRRTFGTDALHDGLDYTPYEGVEVHGAPRAVIVAGEVAIDQGREVERKRSPRYLGRGRHAVAA
jgi:dihydropyrimidinase